MISISRRVNPICEAMQYYSNRVNGAPFEVRWNKCLSSCKTVTEEALAISRKIAALEHKLDALPFPEDKAEFYFKALEGSDDAASIPVSRALMLLQVSAYTDYEKILSSGLSRRGEGERRHDVLLSLTCGGTEFEQDALEYPIFLKALLGLGLRQETKLAALDVLLNFDTYTEELLELMRPAMEIIDVCADDFKAEIEALTSVFETASGPAEVYHKLYRIDISGLGAVNMFPGLLAFGSTALVSIDGDAGEYGAMLGIMTAILISLVHHTDAPDGVPEILKLISDKSRLEILESLCVKSSYGQELAGKLGLTTATVYHHLSRLQVAGLISVETSSARSYYKVNGDTLSKFIKGLEKRLHIEE